jgi:flagellar basal-body rod protein FlgC
MDVSLSALQAQRRRMDVISSNIANADVTNFARTGKPYERQMVTFETVLDDAAHKGANDGGVKVSATVSDNRPPTPIYSPGHPDADKDGMVLFPDIRPAEEMADLMSAARSFEANSAAMKIAKTMFQRSLEIGRA